MNTFILSVVQCIWSEYNDKNNVGVFAYGWVYNCATEHCRGLYTFWKPVVVDRLNIWWKSRSTECFYSLILCFMRYFLICFPCVSCCFRTSTKNRIQQFWLQTLSANDCIGTNFILFIAIQFNTLEISNVFVLSLLLILNSVGDTVQVVDVSCDRCVMYLIWWVNAKCVSGEQIVIIFISAADIFIVEVYIFCFYNRSITRYVCKSNRYSVQKRVYCVHLLWKCKLEDCWAMKRNYCQLWPVSHVLTICLERKQ